MMANNNIITVLCIADTDLWKKNIDNLKNILPEDIFNQIDISHPVNVLNINMDNINTLISQTWLKVSYKFSEIKIDN